jgi:hypothetical protein
MSWKTIAALAVCFGILYAIGIGWGMPSEFVSEIDSEFPSGPFKILAQLDDGSYATPYPVFHKLFMLPLYAAVFIALMTTGGLNSFSSTWPYGFSDPAGAMTALILTARWVSLCMGVGTVCVLALMINRVAGAAASRHRWLVFSPVAAFGLSGVVVYYARTSTYDLPQLFWWSLSFFFLWRFIFETARRRDLVLSALFGALATATKDQTAFFVAGSSLLLFLFPRSSKSFSDKLNDFIIYAICAFCAYAAAAVIVQPYHWISHMKMVLFLNITSGRFAVYSGGISGQIGLFLESMRCLSRIMTPWGLALAAVSLGAIAVKKRFDLLAAIGIPIIVTYFTVFARIHFVFERYMLHYAFLLSLSIACGIGSVVAAPSPQKPNFLRPALAAVVALWLLHQIIFSFIPLTYAQCHDTKKQLSKTLPAIVPEDDTISWQGAKFSLPNADVYTRYRFALPDTVYDSLHSTRMGHVFVCSSEKRTYVLSDRDLFFKDTGGRAASRRVWVDTTGLHLIAMVQDPPFIRNNIRVYTAAHRAMTFRVSIPYYLYKRN